MTKSEIVHSVLAFTAAAAIVGLMLSPLYLIVDEERTQRELEAVPHPERAAAYKEMFTLCLEKLPAGPEVAHYNDWDDVVDSCRVTASRYVDKRFGVLNNAHKVEAR